MFTVYIIYKAILRYKLQLNNELIFDLWIIGGGINGVGIAADAAGRGLSVGLCEAQDFASSTSSSSSKLIHGGLRYLEHYAFGMIRKSLKERTLLLKLAKHLVHPQAFFLPIQEKSRAKWLLRAGLFLYDHLSWDNPLEKTINSKTQAPLKSSFAFKFYDAVTDDSRLVIANAMQAKQKGSKLYNYTRLISATRHQHHWDLVLENTLDQERFEVKSRVLVNATGPWANNILNDILQVQTNKTLSLVKGSHIVFPKLYEGEQAYLLQHSDKRIIFVIPYQKHFTMVGTTDIPYTGDPRAVKIDQEEINYLLKILNTYFETTLSPKDIINTWSGVRPLIDDKYQKKNPAKLSRDYFLELNNPPDLAPILTIFGGKLSTYRDLAEKTIQILSCFYPDLPGPWTHTAYLPGSDFTGTFENLKANLAQDYPWLPKTLLERYASQYGNRVKILLEEKNSLKDLGLDLGHGLYEAEVAYLKKYEWAETMEDILWRRTKLGLFI
jgi:glycerol-3-phosphate dehydrogenase